MKYVVYIKNEFSNVVLTLSFNSFTDVCRLWELLEESNEFFTMDYKKVKE